VSADGWGQARTRSVTWYDPAAAATAAAALSGREILERIISGELPPPPIASLFDAQLVSVGEGEALFRCTAGKWAYNTIGLVHGGFLCTLLDTAAGCAVHTLLPAGAGFASIEIKVSFVRSLRADAGEVEFRGRALRVGRNVAFAEAHAYAGELVGHATTSLALVRAER
jgi:uncharacterized protein (TIGR00369 family)